MDLTNEKKQLMINWAAAFVERGKIDLQTSFATTQLVGEIQASMVPPAEPVAVSAPAPKPSPAPGSEAKVNSKQPAEAEAA